MCINVARRADVTVTEPLLNLLQAHAIGIEQTGAAIRTGYYLSQNAARMAASLPLSPVGKI